MKRIFTVLFAALLLTNLALAEIPDFASMSFEELSDIKQAIDLEYNSRPESEGFILNEGLYYADTDILPGQYYVAMIKPDDRFFESCLCLYSDKFGYTIDKDSSTKDNARYTHYFGLGSDPELVIIRKGDLIDISEANLYFKTSEFNPEDFYKYTPPEGTLIPAGTYSIPEDIPAAKYTVYPGTVKGGSGAHYYDRVNSKGEPYSGSSPISVRVKKEIESDTLSLQDGDKLVISKSIVLAKPVSLNFNLSE